LPGDPVNTYTITVASGSEWLRDTEAPWSYLIEAEDIEAAKRAAEAHHAQEQEDPGCFAIEAIEGLPPKGEYFYNDLRAAYTVASHSDDSGRWCRWSGVRMTATYVRGNEKCPAGCRASRIETSAGPADSQF
jgi:hypothetical protein